MTIIIIIINYNHCSRSTTSSLYPKPYHSNVVLRSLYLCPFLLPPSSTARPSLFYLDNFISIPTCEKSKSHRHSLTQPPLPLLLLRRPLLSDTNNNNIHKFTTIFTFRGKVSDCHVMHSIWKIHPPTHTKGARKRKRVCKGWKKGVLSVHPQLQLTECSWQSK